MRGRGFTVEEEERVTLLSCVSCFVSWLDDVVGIVMAEAVL